MPSLSHLIADKVVRRVLPSDKPLKLWGGYGKGGRCDGCETPIVTTEIEQELDLPGDVVLRFHVTCAEFWRSATGND